MGDKNDIMKYKKRESRRGREPCIDEEMFHTIKYKGKIIG